MKSTASVVRYAQVEAGQVDPDSVRPIPPPGDGWSLYTGAMGDRNYTKVKVWGNEWFLGWCWQRKVPRPTPQ